MRNPFVVAALCVGLAWSGAALAAGIQPISDAERAAVQIAADYLSRGPAAVAEHLAATSPLRKLDARDRLADLEVRLGPADRAQWDLQTATAETKDRLATFSVTYPAGFEDHIAFDLVREGDAYKIQDIRFLALSTSATPAVAEPAKKAVPVPQKLPIAVGAGALAGLLLIAIAIQAMRGRPLRILGVTTAMAVLAAGVLGYFDYRSYTAAVNAAALAAKAPAGPATLAPLLDLRRALCAGTGDVAAAYGVVDRSAGRGVIADLWKIQSDLLQTDTAAAKTALARFKPPIDRPLAELLRGRLALLENDDVGAALAFDNALNLNPGSDALRLENARLLYSLGFEDRAKAHYEKLAAAGSREADVYYTLAAIATADDEDDEAEKQLRKAWAMRPVERAELMSTGEYWSLVRRPGVTQLIGFSAPAERLVESPNIGTRPIRLPIEAERKLSGDFLQITIGKQRLRVPGGAALAPPGSATVEATVWAEEERKQRLEDLQSLLTVGTNAAAYAQPALRERISGTAYVLAARNRWSDLVQLTEGLTPASEHVPPSIFFLRSMGLQRLNRTPEARNLLAQVATSRVLQRRGNAMELMQLAELFAGHDLFDAAVKMYDRSLSIRPNPYVDDRVRQIQMNKRLALNYSTHKTQHFEIHFPDEVNPVSAAQLGDTLETEFRRLLAWIPAADMPMMVVNVVWWREFRATYTGNDFVLAFYNGKITVPFAGLGDLSPQLVAILAHELAHAMIAHATNDQAPHWFQEGFAQRVQGSSFNANAFNMYDDDKFLPLVLLDPVLTGSPDPEMIGAAYLVAQTDIRYIEAKYGKAGLQKIMAAFRGGATTEEAIRAVAGTPLTEFEIDLRKWGRSEQRVFAN